VHLDVVGSDLDNYECPKCGATDRERHLQLYCIHTGLEKQIAGAKILHFAPERHFSKFVQNAGPAQYIKADLYPTSADVQKVDMLEMPFQDESFDIVIANHVLEHVGDDRAALREIRRVLRQGGSAILQTPFGSVLHETLEDEGITSDFLREFLYGQVDHVRLYGRNIFDVFASAGFSPAVIRHDDVLSNIDAVMSGVNAREPFFLFKRN
jgi:SAM-dependent methyltransferase